MLLHPRFAAEGFGGDGGCIVIAVTRQVLNADLSIWQARCTWSN
jgi:hypothetical protein